MVIDRIRGDGDDAEYKITWNKRPSVGQRTGEAPWTAYSVIISYDNYVSVSMEVEKMISHGLS